MPKSELKVSISSEKNVVTMTLTGEAHFDFDAHDSYIREVLSHKPKIVILDTSKLSFVSSVGMNFMINLRRALIKSGGSLRIAALQPMVHSALEKAHILGMFEVFEDALTAKTAKAGK